MQGTQPLALCTRGCLSAGQGRATRPAPRPADVRWCWPQAEECSTLKLKENHCYNCKQFWRECTCDGKTLCANAAGWCRNTACRCRHVAKEDHCLRRACPEHFRGKVATVDGQEKQYCQNVRARRAACAGRPARQLYSMSRLLPVCYSTFLALSLHGLGPQPAFILAGTVLLIIRSRRPGRAGV